ncbi:MAG: Ig domain-containing protein [Fibromonadaceae bacterium]|jgi:hypothetical protein|nr:Ig domain-containing protein [Fibromonadaceae bacterium]
MKANRVLLTAVLVLATAFILSCSNGDDNSNDGDSVAVSSSSQNASISSSSSEQGKSSSSSGQSGVDCVALNSNMAVKMNLNGEPIVVTKNDSVLVEGVNYYVGATQNSIKVSGLKDYIGSAKRIYSDNTAGIIVKDGDNVLAENTDYAIVKTGNSVKIVGINSYSGSVEVELPCGPPVVIPPAITTASLLYATVGIAYSKTLEATGDTPISWSIKSGNLPTGLSFSGNTISGTPTATGTFNIVVEAANAGGSDEKNFSIVVSAAMTEGLMYWGHAFSNDPAIIAEYFDWHLETEMTGLGAGHAWMESSSITGTVKEIQIHAGTGYRVILIPQSAGVPARIDDAIGNDVKEAAFVPVSNITIKGMPYYLFINNGSIADKGFMLTIKW